MSEEHGDITEEEVEEYAQWLGIHDPSLYWIAKKGLTTPLPPHWQACETEEGDYYYNSQTGESSWVNPIDELCRQLHAREVQKKMAQQVSSSTPTMSLRSSLSISVPTDQQDEDVSENQHAPQNQQPLATAPSTPTSSASLVQVTSVLLPQHSEASLPTSVEVDHQNGQSALFPAPVSTIPPTQPNQIAATTNLSAIPKPTTGLAVSTISGNSSSTQAKVVTFQQQPSAAVGPNSIEAKAMHTSTPVSPSGNLNPASPGTQSTFLNTIMSKLKTKVATMPDPNIPPPKTQQEIFAELEQQERERLESEMREHLAQYSQELEQHKTTIQQKYREAFEHWQEQFESSLFENEEKEKEKARQTHAMEWAQTKKQLEDEHQIEMKQLETEFAAKKSTMHQDFELRKSELETQHEQELCTLEEKKENLRKITKETEEKQIEMEQKLKEIVEQAEMERQKAIVENEMKRKELVKELQEQADKELSDLKAAHEQLLADKRKEAETSLQKCLAELEEQENKQAESLREELRQKQKEEAESMQVRLEHEMNAKFEKELTERIEEEKRTLETKLDEIQQEAKKKIMEDQKIFAQLISEAKEDGQKRLNQVKSEQDQSVLEAQERMQSVLLEMKTKEEKTKQEWEERSKEAELKFQQDMDLHLQQKRKESESAIFEQVQNESTHMREKYVQEMMEQIRKELAEDLRQRKEALQVEMLGLVEINRQKFQKEMEVEREMGQKQMEELRRAKEAEEAEFVQQFEQRYLELRNQMDFTWKQLNDEANARLDEERWKFKVALDEIRAEGAKIQQEEIERIQVAIDQFREEEERLKTEREEVFAKFRALLAQAKKELTAIELSDAPNPSMPYSERVKLRLECLESPAPTMAALNAVLGPTTSATSTLISDGAISANASQENSQTQQQQEDITPSQPNNQSPPLFAIVPRKSLQSSQSMHSFDLAPHPPSVPRSFSSCGLTPRTRVQTETQSIGSPRGTSDDDQQSEHRRSSALQQQQNTSLKRSHSQKEIEKKVFNLKKLETLWDQVKQSHSESQALSSIGQFPPEYFVASEKANEAQSRLERVMECAALRETLLQELLSLVDLYHSKKDEPTRHQIEQECMHLLLRLRRVTRETIASLRVWCGRSRRTFPFPDPRTGQPIDLGSKILSDLDDFFGSSLAVACRVTSHEQWSSLPDEPQARAPSPVQKSGNGEGVASESCSKTVASIPTAGNFFASSASGQYSGRPYSWVTETQVLTLGGHTPRKGRSMSQDRPSMRLPHLAISVKKATEKDQKPPKSARNLVAVS